MHQAVTAAILLAATAGAQTLAHKNWAGSGMSPQLWWDRGVFCRVAPGATLKQTEAQADRMASMGCDAVVFSLTAATPLDPKLGALEDADALIEQTGRRKLRLVLDLPLAGATEQDLTTRMKFWLARGVAGFVLTGTPSDPTMVKRLRQVASTALGPRVLIGEGPIPDTQLLLRRLGGGVPAERSLLAGATPSTLLAGSVGAPKPSAAVLLASGLAAELPVEVSHSGLKPTRQFSSDELLLWVPTGDPSLAKSQDETLAALTPWYASLVELHHGNESLRTGQPTYLNHDAEGVLAWLVRARPTVPPVLVVVNLSGKPVKVALRSEVRALNVRGGYLRTLLRSEPGAFATLDAVELAPDGVLIGEIR